METIQLLGSAVPGSHTAVSEARLAECLSIALAGHIIAANIAQIVCDVDRLHALTMGFSQPVRLATGEAAVDEVLLTHLAPIYVDIGVGQLVDFGAINGEEEGGAGHADELHRRLDAMDRRRTKPWLEYATKLLSASPSVPNPNMEEGEDNLYMPPAAPKSAPVAEHYKAYVMQLLFVIAHWTDHVHMLQQAVSAPREVAPPRARSRKPASASKAAASSSAEPTTLGAQRRTALGEDFVWERTQSSKFAASGKMAVERSNSFADLSKRGVCCPKHHVACQRRRRLVCVHTSSQGTRALSFVCFVWSCCSWDRRRAVQVCHRAVSYGTA